MKNKKLILISDLFAFLKQKQLSVGSPLIPVA